MTLDVDELEQGTYVLAVSGGVDSMVLLDLLRRQKCTLIVAYYDHGIRLDSDEDRQLVQRTAENLGLKFETEAGRLGHGASEALAREARYGFLRRVQQKHNARAIITAHHQDDVLETAILNIIRSGGRKAITSLASSRELVRPLLRVSKQDILVYAKTQGIAWREDSTNASTIYARNNIRHTIMPRLTLYDRQRFLHLIAKQHVVNQQIDDRIDELIDAMNTSIKRSTVLVQPYDVASECMAMWLRRHNIELTKKVVDYAVVAAKTLPVGKAIDISKKWRIRIGYDALSLERKPVSGKTAHISV